MSKVDENDSSNDFIIDAFLSALPPAMLFVIRAARAVTLFSLTLLLARAVPTIETGLTLAFCIAALSLFNMTKWVAAAAIGVLLVLAVVPPQVIAAFSR